MYFARVAVPAPLSPLDTLLDYSIPQELEGKIFPGSLVEVPFGRRKTWAVVFEIQNESSFPIEKIKSVERLKFAKPIFDSNHLKFLRWLCEYYFYPIGEVCETSIPGPVRDGTERTLTLKPRASLETKPAQEIKNLNASQAESVTRILSSSSPHLLWGITGSGKTEVYLQAIASTLESGKGAIVLVPEISLTPQLTRRFEERFPGDVAVFHSSQKPSELRRAWLETFYGHKKIAIGARSALFAPVCDPGIIIVDEEHDGSYKQEERLRYHARDCALRLGELYKIPVVLGSATPSAETLFQVQSKKMLQSLLPDRAVGQAKLPQIQLVDLKKGIAEKNLSPEHVENNLDSSLNLPSIRGEFFLSPELRVGLEQTLADKKQAILFLNRRGIGSQLLCRSCGYIFDCPSCDVKLTPHRNRLVCHYCGFEKTLPKICPNCDCDKDAFVQVGVGTAAIEEAVNFHFPKARVLRLDRDTTESRGSLESIVDDFTAQKADILIGTQMVAKGHDFPDVTLVGILLAEMGLGVPDFRAFEKSFQLLLQVSGRAGRSLHPGRVILQSFQPEHPIFSTLESFQGLPDYEKFMSIEISKRAALNYPPNGRLVLLKFDGLDSTLVATAAREVAQALHQIDAKKIQVLGPVVSPISKLRNRYRWQVLIKSQSQPAIQKSIQWICDGWEKQKMERTYKTRMLIDVDPVQMM